jgi:hypothetical protein
MVETKFSKACKINLESAACRQSNQQQREHNRYFSISHFQSFEEKKIRLKPEQLYDTMAQK